MKFLTDTLTHLKTFNIQFFLLNTLLKLKKDRHGNILLGVDTQNYLLWNYVLKPFLPEKLFGPGILATHPQLIGSVLTRHKTGDDAKFNGNPSTTCINFLTGQQNIFNAQNIQTHSAHKQSFKHFLSDKSTNARRAQAVTHDWLQYHLETNASIDDEAIENLAAMNMLSFLLTPEVAREPRFIHAIIILKQHFVNYVTYKPNPLDQYGKAHALLENEIIRLTLAESDSLAKQLKDEGKTPSEIVSHIISLMMVGFDNLLSSLMTLMIRLQQFPEYRENLHNDLTTLNGHDYIDFDTSSLSMTSPNTFSQMFYNECLRLTPPVWLQARKNKEAQTIRYTDATGTTEMTLPSGAFMLIPNYPLARQIPDGDTFNPLRQLDASRFYNPFSTGINACPGRNIAFATAGVLFAEIIKQKIPFIMLEQPRHDIQVSLKWKNIAMQANADSGVLDRMKQARQQQQTRHYRQSAEFGLLVTLAVLLESESFGIAYLAGALATLMSLWNFSAPLVKKPNRAQLFTQALAVGEEKEALCSAMGANFTS